MSGQPPRPSPPDVLVVIRSDGGPDRGQINPPGTGTFGFLVLLASLGALFLSTIAGYLYVRLTAPSWPPAGSPALPATLWLSTGLILATSWSIQRAMRAVRRDDLRGLRRSLVLTFLLGCLFLIVQITNYLTLAAMSLTAKTNLYGFTFYMLTFLHGLHVVGGLTPLALVVRRAWAGRYTSFYHPGIRYQAMYWHFLDFVWVVLFLVLLAGS